MAQQIDITQQAQAGDDSPQTQSTTTPTYTLPQLYQALQPLETKDERQKRERQERRRLTWKSIGDGISAIANLVGATQGAPTISTPQLTAHEQKRMESALAERNRRRSNYIQAYLNQNKADASERRNQFNQELATRKFEWQQQMANERFNYQKEKDRIEQEYRERLLTLDERNYALRELEAYNRIYGTTTTQTTTTTPRGTSTSTRTTTRTPAQPAATQPVLPVQPDGNQTLSLGITWE